MVLLGTCAVHSIEVGSSYSPFSLVLHHRFCKHGDEMLIAEKTVDPKKSIISKLRENTSS